jgi:prepilin-type N-terminal cleavage/methylation domain-containing protein
VFDYYDKIAGGGTMKRTIINQKGLSLIEVMVTSVIASIFGLIIYSVFLIYNNSSRISISFFFLQQQYENVAHQIARDVRKASFVLKMTETPTQRGAGYDTVSSIVLWQGPGPFSQYTLSSGKLLEGGRQVEYSAGGSSVAVNSDSSYFIMDPQRKKVTIHLSLKMVNLKTTYTLSPREEIIVCRN